MAKLIKYPHVNQLTEAFQANDMRFSFCNRKDTPEGVVFEAVHPFVKCREYFNELLMTNHHPEFQYKPVYGFNYKQKEFPLNLDGTRIAIKFPNIIAAKTFEKNLNWLHIVEDFNGVDRTVLHKVDKDKHIVIVEGSKMWVQKCVLTNIYTLLLKLCALDIMTHTTLDKLSKLTGNLDATPSEVSYIQQVGIDGFNNLLENCTVIAELPTKYVDGSNELRSPGEVHAYSGIIHIKQIIGVLNRDPNYMTKIRELIELFKSLFAAPVKTEFLKAK